LLTSIEPSRAVEGGRVALHATIGELPSIITVGGMTARVSYASSNRLIFTVPDGIEGGKTSVQFNEVESDSTFLSVGKKWATGLHQVDNPIFDASGNLYVTYSGSRGQETPVSIFRVTQQGTRQSFASGIVNATSMVVGPDGDLYVSSRFEGLVYRVRNDGTHDVIASDLGVACGLAFDSEGCLYVGDRTGTVFRVLNGNVKKFATIPPSIAAFHLAISPEDELYISAPTLATYDYVYRINRKGDVSTLPQVFGRPQGLAFDSEGQLYVIEALAGASGLYRIIADGTRQLVVAARALVGVAFGSSGNIAVVSNETAYHFDGEITDTSKQ